MFRADPTAPHPLRRLAALASLAACLALAACKASPSPFHARDITGALPTLQFTMQRANDGKPVTADDYRGRIALLYFGYTNCPDVCPLTLANLSQALTKLGDTAKQVRVLFVSVDPDRDTLPALKAYVDAFSPEVDGLRGTDNEVAAMARRYRVAYSVTKAGAGHPYEVMHSAAVFFFDRTGRARLVTLDTSNTSDLASDLKRLIRG
jgi:protein SCO1/2